MVLPLDGGDSQKNRNKDSSSDQTGKKLLSDAQQSSGSTSPKDNPPASPPPETAPVARIGADGSITFGHAGDGPATPGDVGPSNGQTAKPGVTRDTQGQVTQVTYKDGTSTKFSYDATGKLDQVVQPNGMVDKQVNGKWTSHGGFGFSSAPTDITSVQVNQDGSWSYSTNQGAQIKTNVDGSGTTTTDGGKIVVHTGLGGNVNSFTIDGQTYNQGTDHTKFVDNKDNPTGYGDVQLGSNGQLSYTDNNTGQLVSLNADGSKSFQNPDGTAIQMDAKGRVTSAAGLNSSESFTYGLDGHINTFTDSKGDVYTASGDSSFKDKSGDTISNLRVNAQGDVTYNNSAGQLVVNDQGTSFTTNEKVSPNVTLDAQGNPSSVKYPDGTERSFGYNQNGQLTSFTEKGADGQSHTYWMENSGQWVDANWHNMDWSNVSVDAAGNFSTANSNDGPVRTSLTNGSTETTYASGFSKETNAKGEAVQYTDSQGNVFTNDNGQFKDKNGDVITSNEVPPANLPHHIERPEPDEYGPSYTVKNSSGQISESIYSNGESRQYGYDSSGKLDKMTFHGQTFQLQGGQWTVQSAGGAVGSGPFGAGETGGASLSKGMGSGLENGESGTQKPIPAGISDVSLDQYGQLSYKTSDGGSVTVANDGSSMTQKSDGSWVDANPDGNTTFIVSKNGKVDSFGYDQNGNLNSVDMNGKSYYLNTDDQNAKWKNADGSTSYTEGFNVSRSGSVSYEDATTGQQHAINTDGSSSTFNYDGSTIQTNAQGQVTEIIPSQSSSPFGNSPAKAAANQGDGNSMSGGTPGSSRPRTGPETFAYDSHGISQYTDTSGDVYKRQADGSFVDQSGQQISNLSVSSDGAVSYLNQSNKYVIVGHSGQANTSTETAAELQQTAGAIHGANASDLPGMLHGLSNTDLSALQDVYKKEYGTELTTDLAKRDGAASAPELLDLVNAQSATIAGRPAASNNYANVPDDQGEVDSTDLHRALSLGISVDPSVQGVIDKAALNASLAKISPGGIDQGGNGDCVFEASLAGMASTPDGQRTIRDMITTNANGTYTVTFPGDKSHPVTVNQADLAATQTQDSDLWAHVVEAALVKSRPEVAEAQVPDNAPGGTDGKPPFIAQYDDYLLTGKVAQDTQANASNEASVIQAAEKNKQTIDLDCINDDHGTMISGHEWTLMNYDPKTGDVIVRNPWGNNPQLPVGQSANGVTDLGNGEMEMSFASFQKFFGTVTIANDG